jgi:hypothetical protein
MKKSFILSLVMVVVLIASLATATYAWYTAQTRVDVTATTIYTAETSDTLVISDTIVTDPTWAANSVTLTMGGASAGTGINPMLIDSGAALSTATKFSELAFLTTTLDAQGKANGGSEGAPANLTAVTDNVDETGTLIYVANPGKSAATYYVKVTFANEGVTNKGLRVAIFKTASITAAYADASAQETAVNNATLVGIWAPTGEKVGYMDTIAAETQFTSGVGFTGENFMQTNDPSAIVFASGAFSTTAQTLAAYDNTNITNNAYTVVAWYEGDKVNNGYAGLASSFTIEFNKYNS